MKRYINGIKNARYESTSNCKGLLSFGEVYSMMKFFKTYIVNVLSLINIIFAFIFTLVFAIFYKVTSLADSYFYALIIYSNILLFVQLFYSTFFNIYLHTQDEKKKNNLYYMLQFEIILISMIVICIYFFATSLFPLLNNSTKTYLDIYIFTLLFIPLIEITIQLMNAKKKFHYAYFYPIGRSFLALTLLLVFQWQSDLMFLAHGFLLYDCLYFIFIFYKAIKILGIQTIYFDYKMFSIILHKSFMDKTGQFFLALPELMIANILTQQFPGILAFYSYIKKFVIALIQFIFIPQLTMFATQIARFLQKKKFIAIQKSMKRLLLRTIPYSFLGAFTLGIILPDILTIFLSKEIVSQNFFTIYVILGILYLQNMIIIFEYPYGTIINQKLMFEYGLLVKFISFLFFLLFYYFYLSIKPNLEILLFLGVIPNFLILYLYKNKSTDILKGKTTIA